MNPYVVGEKGPELIIMIRPDVERFRAAMETATATFVALGWRLRLAGQRDRSRLVTRRKQRGAW